MISIEFSLFQLLELGPLLVSINDAKKKRPTVSHSWTPMTKLSLCCCGGAVCLSSVPTHSQSGLWDYLGFGTVKYSLFTSSASALTAAIKLTYGDLLRIDVLWYSLTHGCMTRGIGRESNCGHPPAARVTSDQSSSSSCVSPVVWFGLAMFDNSKRVRCIFRVEMKGLVSYCTPHFHENVLTSADLSHCD